MGGRFRHIGADVAVGDLAEMLSEASWSGREA